MNTTCARCAFPLLLGAILFIAWGIHRAGQTSSLLELPRVMRDSQKASFRIGISAYPRQALDTEAYRVTMARPAQRIVSQYWSIDDFVYSIVPPHRVVAVSESAYQRSFSNVYQWAERHRPVIATDPERVLRVDPDLILVSSSGRADYTSLLRNAGIPTFRLFTAFTTLNQISENILLVGYLTGEDESAGRLSEQFRRAVDRGRSRRPSGWPPPRILGYAGRYSYGSQTLFHDIVRTLGGINLGADHGLKGYDSVNTEQVLRWDPEWIVSGADRGKTGEILARLLQDPAIALTTAAKKGQILVFENNVFLPMSPYSTLLLNAMADAIYSKPGAPTGSEERRKDQE